MVTSGLAETSAIAASSRAVKKKSTATMMSGITVYMISSGRLYRICAGRPVSVRRRRYATTHQMMRPQTRNPTSHAAIHEPFQSVMIRPVWLVVVGVEGSHPVSRRFSHPERTRAAPTPPATTAARRLLPRCARTPSCERNAGLPMFWARLLELPGLDDLERTAHYRVPPPAAPGGHHHRGASDLPASDPVPDAGTASGRPVRQLEDRRWACQRRRDPGQVLGAWDLDDAEAG